VTIQGFINNKDASKRGAVKLISLGEGNKIAELNAFPDFINGYSSPDTPEKLTYTLVEDQPNLSLVRDGNTGTNLMFISVVRDPGTGGENPEPGPTPSGDHSVGMNTLNNQMLLQLGSGDVKYYNTADLAEVNIDKATGTVSVTPLAGDWNDEFKQNVTAIRFAKAPETGADAEISNKGVNITEAKGWLESVYAKWVSVDTTFNVYYYIGNGTFTPPETHLVGELLPRPADPVQEGYDFGGWYLDSACLTTPWDFDVDRILDTVTLYPKWTKKTCTVTFDSQGGSYSISHTAAWS